VLEGEYELFSVGETLRAVAGSLVCVPKGTLHAHKNIGEGVGRMLVVQTPGGLYERSFEEVGAPSDGGSASLAEEDRLNLKTIAAIGAGCGIEMARPVARHGRACPRLGERRSASSLHARGAQRNRRRAIRDLLTPL
jgi:hypothetical protein